MGLWANAADPVGDVGHVFGHPTDAELLEAAQFRDLQVGVCHLALLVQENINFAVAFEAGDWINGYTFHLLTFLSGRGAWFTVTCCSHPTQLAVGHCEAIECSRWVWYPFFDNAIDLFGVFRVDDRGQRRHHAGAEIGNSFVWPVAADTGRSDRRAERTAAGPGSDAKAQQTLVQQALLRIGDDLPGSFEFLDLLFFTGA